LIRAHQTDRLELSQARVLANPGSVGQPRDGDPRAAYLTLDTETRTVSWHRVAYDVEPVRRAIRAAGLPARLGDRLVVGV
jgi:diadenosine tetraphosphatase ApaH/serine/threonine PP2A family protein phosphatase